MYQHLIKELQTVLKEAPDFFSLEALQEFEELQNSAKDSSQLTETGARILQWMQESAPLYHNLFSANLIATSLGMTSSRSASGALRKLVEMQYVEKTGSNPVTYSLTQSGKGLTF